MRYFITLYFLLASLAPARAQDWAPVQPGQLYHYATNGGTRLADVARTVAIDSVSATTGTLHLNRIVVQCPWCPGSTVMGNGQATRALRRQPHFMMRHARHLGGGHWWLFDTASYALHTHAGVGHSWVFDTLNNITATVLGAAPGFVLGIADSIKTLQTSVGGIIQVSKHHGIVRWQLDSLAYQLIGWEVQNQPEWLGVRWPSVADIFNRSVGYEYTTSNGGGSANTGNFICNCCLITGVIPTDTYVSYFIRCTTTPYTGIKNPPPYPYSTYNSQFSLSRFERLPLLDGYIGTTDSNDSLYLPSVLFSANGDSIRMIGAIPYLSSQSKAYTVPMPTQPWNYGDTLHLIGNETYLSEAFWGYDTIIPYGQYHLVYGVDNYVFNQQDNTNHHQCHNTVSGTAPDVNTSPSISVAQTLNYIQVRNLTANIIHINLQDATGRIIRTATLAPHATTEWGTEILPAGIYIVRATNGHTAQYHRCWVP